MKALAGDIHLGGEDFILRLVDYCLEEFKLHAGNLIDLRGNIHVMNRLREECEMAMKLLSSEHEIIIKVEKAFSGFDLKVSVTR